MSILNFLIEKDGRTCPVKNHWTIIVADTDCD